MSNKSSFLCGQKPHDTNATEPTKACFGHLQLPEGDFEAPLPVGTHAVTQKMFSPFGHKVDKRIGLSDLLDSTRAQKTRPWQPAGAVAQRRIVAAAAALLDVPYSQIGSLWTCCLMGHGLLFLRDDGKAFVSLGPTKWMWMAWPLVKRVVPGSTFWFLDEKEYPVLLSNNSVLASSKWKGLPVEIRSPTTLPAGEFAVAWQQVGDDELLLAFALRHGVRLTKEDLTNLCEQCDLTPSPLPGEKSITVRSLATALVAFVFDGELPCTREAIVDLLIGSRPKRATSGDAQKALDALACLDESEREEFKKLKEHCTRVIEEGLGDAGPVAVSTQSRVGSARGSKQNMTPMHLRKLIPFEGGRPAVCSLCWQATARAFQGYYTGAVPRSSVSHSYQGPRTPDDPVLALSFVVRWLWSKHGQPDRCPDDESIRQAFELAHHERSMVAFPPEPESIPSSGAASSSAGSAGF
jgi:hypothetical protein